MNKFFSMVPGFRRSITSHVVLFIFLCLSFGIYPDSLVAAKSDDEDVYEIPTIGTYLYSKDLKEEKRISCYPSEGKTRNQEIFCEVYTTRIFFPPKKDRIKEALDKRQTELETMKNADLGNLEDAKQVYESYCDHALELQNNLDNPARQYSDLEKHQMQIEMTSAQSFCGPGPQSISEAEDMIIDYKMKSAEAKLTTHARTCGISRIPSTLTLKRISPNKWVNTFVEGYCNAITFYELEKGSKRLFGDWGKYEWSLTQTLLSLRPECESTSGHELDKPFQWSSDFKYNHYVKLPCDYLNWGKLTSSE